MKKAETLRLYNFSDATLKQLIDQAISFARRDSAEFGLRGYSSIRLDLIAQQNEDFGNIMSDEEAIAEQMQTTENKDIARNTVEDTMRVIFSMAQNQYGAKSIQYKRFGESNISQQTDNDLVRTARICHKTSTSKLNDLQNEGLTQLFLDNFLADIQAFDTSLDLRQLAVSDREIAKEERVRLGNAVYEEFVKLCNTGKSIWRTSNEAKYSDYVIYDSPSGKSNSPDDAPIEDYVEE